MQHLIHFGTLRLEYLIHFGTLHKLITFSAGYRPTIPKMSFDKCQKACDEFGDQKVRLENLHEDLGCFHRSPLVESKDEEGMKKEEMISVKEEKERLLRNIVEIFTNDNLESQTAYLYEAKTIDLELGCLYCNPAPFIAPKKRPRKTAFPVLFGNYADDYECYPKRLVSIKEEFVRDIIAESKAINKEDTDVSDYFVLTKVKSET